MVKKCDHLEAERQQIEYDQSFMDPFSANVEIIKTLLKAGTHLNDTSTGLNPVTVHLMPREIGTPNSYILKMLSAAGAEDEEIFTSYVKCLQELVRDSIRKYLKQIHPETNLYYTTPQLGLPHLLQSYLLFYTLLKNNSNLQENKKRFMSKILEGDDDSILRLIQAGVDVNIQNENGATALMTASEAGHVELIKELIIAGVDKDIQYLHSDTALIYASRVGKQDCLEMLLNCGANTNIRGQNGKNSFIARYTQSS